ncbi:hypothetical protein Gotur_013318 [Gossypium turneri]
MELGKVKKVHEMQGAVAVREAFDCIICLELKLNEKLGHATALASPLPTLLLLGIYQAKGPSAGTIKKEANQASSFNGAHLNNGNPVPETSGLGMKHNPGISLDLTLEEQAILDDERVVDPMEKPTHFAARPNLSPYAPPVIPMDYDDGIPYRGGVIFDYF